MKKNLCISMLLLLILSGITFAQAPDTLWTAWYNGPADGWDNCFGCTIDNSTYLYVTGYSDNGTNDDYLTIKYNANTGDTVWTKRYNGPANSDDWGCNCEVDVSGNLFVTGVSNNSTNDDCLTIKYNANTGDTIWTKRYNGPANGGDWGFDCAVDGGGNLYVTGISWNGTNDDYLTIKYNADTGDTIWTKRYNGPANSFDESYSCVIDGSGNLYVTGSSASGATRDLLTVKYNSIGDTIWTRRYETYVDTAEMWNGGCAVDGADNLYVTGQYFNGSDYDAVTIKYTSAGNTAWTTIYDSENEGSTACFADNSGNLYVVGANRTVHDYMIIAYNATTGDTLWTTAFDGGGYDYAMDCVVDDQGHLYVNGSSMPATNMDYLIIKYNTGTGVEENLDNRLEIADFILQQNAPNPFMEQTAIKYQLKNYGFVNLSIYNVTGQKVKTLVNEYAEAGVHRCSWNGRDKSAKKVASGMYLVRLKTGNKELITKMVVVK